jgi:6-pyruvoyl-tetrahydropterin synthase
MYQIRKKYLVEYAHQLHDAYTKCCYETIHGHTGTIELFFCSEALDHNDMVIDFGEISSIVKAYIEKSLDHALIVPKTFEPAYVECLKQFNKKLIVVDNNPTAEYFAESIYWDIKELLEPILKKHNRVFWLQKVRFHETQTGYAEFIPDSFE